MTRGWLGVMALAVLGSGHASAHEAQAQVSAQDIQRFELRNELIKEYPHIRKAMMHSPNAGFGGDSSPAVGYHMYSRTDQAAIDAVRAKLKVETYGEGTWLLRLPYVNIAVFETSDGLVLVDSGYAPAGPALLETLRKLSRKPVHTIIYTHHHADHAFGAWALLEAGEKPRIIAEESFLHELGLDVRLANYTNVKLNDQAPQDVPRNLQDVVLPTETFRDKTTLTIGGEAFVLTHARGETADHLWVHVPGRKVVVSADYHQPFLVNAGNGKRRQRYALEWAGALRDMAATQPALLLPMHGPAIAQPAQIQDRLTAMAEVLESVDRQVVAGLNAGQRQDQVAAAVKLPPTLAGRPDMEEYYNRVQDIGKMVAREYSGWWDDIPSQWTPAPLEQQARELAALAGGVDKLAARSEALLASDPAMACHLADWALFAAPDDPAVLRTVLKAYANRIQPGVPAQEINVYLAHMSGVKQRLLQVSDPKRASQ